jgi:dimethylglycine dehydrogenase
MADMPTQARVVIIGGGVVGVSALYHLCKAGWTDCVLLEKNELTAGSTWHAAGNVPTFSTSWSIMNMQRYSTELYRGLGEAVDYAMNYHVTGSIRLGHSEERMQEFARARGMGLYQGMNLEILAPDEIRDKYPFIETHDLKGALYDPADGDIDPAQLTQALAKGARDLGATILRFCPATGVSRENGEWIVHTEKGDIRCEIVVNAAGYYAQRVGEWFKPFGGRTVPMMVMSHQYLIFDEVPAVRDWSAEVGHKLPLLRDVDVSYYLRQEKNGFNLGPYERPARRIGPTRPIPCPRISAFSFIPTRSTGCRSRSRIPWPAFPCWPRRGWPRRSTARSPMRPTATRCSVRCRACPTPSRPASSPSASRRAAARARCWPNGSPKGSTEWDMWSCDPRRFTDYTDHDYCVRRGWRSTATNTGCISLGTAGPPRRTGRSPRFMIA